MRRVTYKELADMLTYDPDTGRLFWKDGYGRRYSGKEAGCIKDKTTGRFKVKHKGKRYFRSRLAWVIYYGEEPKGYIDHLNGVEDDDRIANLRDVTPLENSLNCKRYSKNKSGYTGVYKNEYGTFSVTYRKDYLGTYKTFEEAVKVRKEAEKACPHITNRHGKEG